jgi:hypothetical protein
LLFGVSHASANPDDYQLMPKRVVIVIAKTGKLLDADSLYTFTQVNLGRQDRTLASRSVDVFVVPIIKGDI